MSNINPNPRRNMTPQRNLSNQKRLNRGVRLMQTLVAAMADFDTAKCTSAATCPQLGAIPAPAILYAGGKTKRRIVRRKKYK